MGGVYVQGITFGTVQLKRQPFRRSLDALESAGSRKGKLGFESDKFLVCLHSLNRSSPGIQSAHSDADRAGSGAHYWGGGMTGKVFFLFSEISFPVKK